MATYVQFESLARSDPYFLQGGNYFPNDNYPNGTGPYTYYKPEGDKDIRSPSNYRVYYRELNDHITQRTLEYRGHCKQLPSFIQYEVEACSLVIPGSALVKREPTPGTFEYVSVLDEPYIYVRIASNENSQKNKIVTNNPNGTSATFIMYHDKTQIGTDNTTNAISRPNDFLPTSELDNVRWLTFKSCMDTVMRINLSNADQWHVRIFDRYGNDIIISEDDNGGAGFTTPPAVDPDLQTMFLMGIKPEYPESL